MGERARRVCGFIERNCYLPGARPFILDPWERDFIADFTPGAPARTGRSRAGSCPSPRKTGKRWPSIHRSRRRRAGGRWAISRTGDVIYGSGGEPVRVALAHPVFYAEERYRLEFMDGESIVASGDHLWTVERRVRTRKGRGGVEFRRETVSTAELAAEHTERRYWRWRIPLAGPLVGPVLDLPIHPTCSGAWLGDGNTWNSGLSQAAGDEAVVEAVEGCGYEIALQRSGNWWIYGLMPALRALGVLGAKHIPESYLRASVMARRALLQGLLDTDGHAGGVGRRKGRQIEFTTTSPALAVGAVELIRSLGFRCRMPRALPSYLKGERKRDKYRVSFDPRGDRALFRHPRKVAAVSGDRGTARLRHHFIRRIERVEPGMVRCLTVEAPDRLYLAGRCLIPTHNSEIGGALVLVHVAGPEAGHGQRIVSAAAGSRDQAGIIFDRASRMVQENPALAAVIEITPSRKRLHHKTRLNTYEALQTKARTVQGEQPAFWIYDEYAQALDDDLYDALDRGQGAVPGEGLGLVISTRSHRPGNPMADLLDMIEQGKGDGSTSHWISHVYSADPELTGDAEFEWENVAKANPGLGTVISRESVQKEINEARMMPGKRAKFRAYRLNIEASSANQLVDLAVWNKAAMAKKPIPRKKLYRSLRGERCIGGLDMSRTTDLTSLALWFPGSRDPVGGLVAAGGPACRARA